MASRSDCGRESSLESSARSTRVARRGSLVPRLEALQRGHCAGPAWKMARQAL